MEAANIALGILLGWNIVLTLLFVKIIKHYQRLVGGSKGANLEKILDSVLRQTKNDGIKIDKLEENLAILQKASSSHFQKKGLVRFNPFADMGGSQSFSLALLDGENCGLVITCLHGRSSTHLYICLLYTSPSPRD